MSISEEEYFRQWAYRYRELVMQENSALTEAFTIEAERDDRGCMVPSIEITTTDKEHQQLLWALWLQFLKSDPYGA